jgi:hypothetical protein
MAAAYDGGARGAKMNLSACITTPEAQRASTLIALVTTGAVASLLLAHDTAFDEHHDQPAFLLAVAQAISSGSRKGLTLIEGLPVSRLHVVHHVAHASLLLGKSGAADADGDEDGNNQGVHACLLLQLVAVYDAVKF